MKKLVNLMFLGSLFLCLVFMAQTSTAVTMDDAIGIWLFDEGSGDTTADASGNENGGKLMEGPSWVDGKFGGGLSFDVAGGEFVARLVTPRRVVRVGLARGELSAASCPDT